MLDVSVGNSYCLYKPERKKDISIADFYLTLMKQTLQNIARTISLKLLPSLRIKSPPRLTARHISLRFALAVVIEESQQENALFVRKMTDDEKVTVVVKFAT